MQIPRHNQVIAIARSFEEVAVAFRTIKEMLALSNEFCDEVGGLTKGHTDKLIGPSRSKNFGPVSFDTFCEMFAVEFQMVVNMDAVHRMQKRWEGRDISNVRTDAPKCSKILIERVKPAVYAAQMENARAAYYQSSAGEAPSYRAEGGQITLAKMAGTQKGGEGNSWS